MRTVLSIAMDALAYGMVLFIISIGLSIMMGLMRVVNLAHGAFAMIGGYFASYAIADLGASYGVAILLSVAATILVAIPFERLLYRRIYRNTDPLIQVLMTIGVTFVIVGLANFVFGPTMKPIALPQVLSGPIDIGFRSMPTHRLFVIACGAATALVLWLLVEKTEFGIKLRASVDNSGMAEALGIRTEIIYAVTFALAVGLGAFGGVIGAEILPIEPYYALRYMVTFLVVVSVGGAGSIPGALAASLLLGLADTTGKYLAPEYGEFFFYLAVIVIVSAFPCGLFGRAH
ncbi:branched-chain amino acid ABC transporter permease [Bosea sp. PAMC 26642]|uniref:branched-chain amino acid ABC transporter permease n=1 Tax=Bosea sp. (strain PAMC 26642) TaxID=1792307 RepID=UPI0007704626|nr:branched-chain amino acid ABC transporter permease [Bosea sp. PAMC 26642]AMJ61815.1 ABC transporter permease [Bosea sp. PAMC 26642]